MMWHHPEFAGGGGCWDGGATGPGVELVGGGSSGLIPADTPPAYNHHQHHPSSGYGCSFSATPGGGGYVGGGYDGTMMAAGAGPPYYGMYNLPSLAAASPWSASHTPSLAYTAVRRSFSVHSSPRPGVNIIRRKRSCSASDSAYSYRFLRSVVCLSVCRLAHSCTLLKPFGGFTCHLAGTLVGSNGTLC